MKVYVVREPARQTLLVYAQVADDGTKRAFLTGPDGRLHWVEHGEEPPSYVRLDERIAEALVEAIEPRPVATERHLDDAIKVRDALLGMVERTVYPTVVTER
jgi:hypothetical protein